MTSFDYQKSTITKYRAGTSADPYIDITETKKVINGQIQLNEIPVLLNKVKINNMFEVPTSNKKDLEENEYRVDYVEGMLYFHPSVEGSTLTYNFRGRGNHFISADRVWTKESDGQVLETLGDILSAGSDAIGNIQQLVELIHQTETVRDETREAINEADQSALEAHTQAQYAEAVGDSLIHKGNYSSSVGYVVRNMVYYLGSTYMCIANTTGNLPTDIAKWKKITNMIWKGIYSASTTYNFGDVVGDSVKENVYMCISDGTLNKALTTVANWTPMLSVADAILNVNTKATHAQTQGDYAKTQGDYAKNLINMGIYNSATTYKALNIVVYSSGVWQCLQDSTGVEPTALNYLNWQLLMQSAASVTWDSVAGRPDVEGHIANQDIHVTAAKQTAWDTKETTTGSQTKATQALTDAKTYTDTKTPDASVTQKGVIQLVNTATSTSTVLAPTANALKTVKDSLDSLAGVGNTKTVKVLDDQIGILSNLTTTNKASLVGAVNETVSQLAETVKVFNSPFAPTQANISAMKSGDLFIVYGAVYVKPNVVSVSPANGAKIQSTSRPKIVATFNTIMKSSTIESFKIYPTSADRTAGTNAIPGTVSQSGDGLSWTFIPSNDLTYLNTYYARIGTAAQSASGADMGNNYDFSFICGRGAYTVKPIVGYSYDDGTNQWGGIELGTLDNNGANAGFFGFGVDSVGSGEFAYAHNGDFQAGSHTKIEVTRTIGWRKWEFRPLTGELLLDDVVRYTHPTARRVTRVYLVAVREYQPIYIDDVTTEDFVDGFENGLDVVRWDGLIGGITATKETSIKRSGVASVKLVGTSGFDYRSHAFLSK